MKSLWNKVKNLIPIKIVKKENFDYLTKQLEVKTRDNYRLKNNNEILKKDIQRLEEKIIPVMPIIYGLKSQYNYKDRLLYFTTTIDSEIFYQIPQINGKLDYLVDYICYAIRKELSLINITRLPDYCRKIERNRYEEIKANLYPSGKIEER